MKATATLFSIALMLAGAAAHRAVQAAPSTSPRPSSFAPRGEPGPHAYGAPIQAPILHRVHRSGASAKHSPSPGQSATPHSHKPSGKHPSTARRRAPKTIDPTEPP